MKTGIFALAIALGSVFLLSSCSDNNALTSAQNSGGAESVQSPVSSRINEQDVQDAINAVKKKSIETIEKAGFNSVSYDELDTYIKNTEVYDIDFDGSDELLVVDSYSLPRVHVFEKNNGIVEESSIFEMKALEYMNDKLELKPFENGTEKYHYFTFHEGNGVMKADVLGEVRPDENGYSVDYLYSWGTLEYNHLSEPIVKEFYRKGWNKSDVALEDTNQNDIPKETLVNELEKYNISINSIADNESSAAESSSVVSDDIITENDVETVRKSYPEDRYVYDTKIIDLDFDGEEELLVLAGLVNTRPFEVWEKNSGEMQLSCRFGGGELKWIDKISLKQGEIDGEKLYLFTFSMSGENSMTADEVLSVVRKTADGYEVEHLLSRGRIDYDLVSGPVTKIFYRKGWSKYDLGMDNDYGDISKEEYERLYEEYTSGIIS